MASGPWSVAYEVAGPMGRAYLMLPCKHQRARLPFPFNRSFRRKCQVCLAAYVINLREEQGQAQVVKLIPK